MKALQTRLDLILERIESPKFLKNDGLGNEIGFWVFDYPAKYELLVRDHLKHVDEKLNKRGYRFVHLNIFEVLIDMLEERGLFDRACQRELQVGVDGLRKTLAGPLSQEKVARYIADKYKPSELEFVLLSGLGSAWPLVRGHELLSALQDVMGSTPLVLFYPGEYSGRDLHPFGMIESKNYYRAFKLVPEDGKKPFADNKK
ncbi:DUF1788 domain-containing protein [Vibrio parahaemolyticus]|nr:MULTISPECIES: DUF1788 domain-containing protein [Vibrio]EGR2912417.1 DUF1788 domain-containing protein [Vibrio parahaemolyticus]EGR3154159.1 DUF1788 domain-containing protein [Vibrio parahaemolyticus]EHV9685944.1 DUF1788 domain-containing protein [Vibrio parahaemolyticus]EIE1212143.1 DUF1788 domain-containing protein [Vibrio parahaemolyticus]EJC7075887.1 DUF1788 domain-containing protein [Vibrio parahaemolyticus]